MDCQPHAPVLSHSVRSGWVMCLCARVCVCVCVCVPSPCCACVSGIFPQFDIHLFFFFILHISENEIFLYQACSMCASNTPNKQACEWLPPPELGG